jgi:hypothetical protein
MQYSGFRVAVYIKGKLDVKAFIVKLGVSASIA